MSSHPHIDVKNDQLIASKMNTAEALLLDQLVEIIEINLTKAIQQSNDPANYQSDINLTPELFTEATQAALSNVLYNQFKFTQKSARKLSTAIQSPAQSTHQSNDCNSSSKRKPIRCYLDGCFDMMHSGHYNAIRQAKQLTDGITERDPVTGEMVKLPGVLVVGVHSDAEIAKHKGGPPVMNDHERLEMVKNCKWVDEVVFDTPYNPSLALLDSLNCDFCVHGDDFTVTADGKDAYWEVKEAGRMKIFKRTEGVSTTDLVGRLLYMTREHHLSSQSVSTPTAQSADLALKMTGSPLPTSRNIAPPTPGRKASSPAMSSPSQLDPFASRGISTFLPTTYRITQFSNNRIPGPEDRIVYIDGAFDLFHIGHVETLKKAAALGTFLYVGVHDDATINQQKGYNYPIMNLHERVLNVLSCFCVDEVVIGAPWRINEDLIKSLGIHVVVTGSNTKLPLKSVMPKSDPYEVAKRLGIYQEIDTSYLLETDQVVQRIVDNRLKFEAKNAARSIKEKDYLTNNKQFIREI